MKGHIRQTTYVTYKGYIEHHIKKYFFKIRLTDLSSSDIQEFIAELNGGGKGLSPKSIHLIAAVFKNILSCAVEFGYINQNLFRKIYLPKLNEKEAKAFSRAEQQSIEAAVRCSLDKRDIGILICLYTGIRLGELCALKWTDIDFKNKYIKIKSSLKRVYLQDSPDIKKARHKTACIEEEPKTQKSLRTIPLPDFLCDMLRALQKSSPGHYVVSMKNGNYVKPRTMQLLYSRLLNRANVPYNNFHTLRHTFASRALELSADIKTVSDILGHTNSTFTLNRYAHSLLEQKRKLMTSFDCFFEKRLSRKN